ELAEEGKHRDIIVRVESLTQREEVPTGRSGRRLPRREARVGRARHVGRRRQQQEGDEEQRPLAQYLHQQPPPERPPSQRRYALVTRVVALYSHTSFPARSNSTARFSTNCRLIPAVISVLPLASRVAAIG